MDPRRRRQRIAPAARRTASPPKRSPASWSAPGSNQSRSNTGTSGRFSWWCGSPGRQIDETAVSRTAAAIAQRGMVLHRRAGYRPYSVPPLGPIRSNVSIDVQTASWLFGRGDQMVKIERLSESDEDLTLVITANDDPPRRYADRKSVV